MEPGRTTQGIWVMAVFLGAAAIALDNPAFFLATASLVLLSAALAIRFRQRMHRIVVSATVMRSADRKAIQQGGVTTITTAFSCTPERGSTVEFRDIIPARALADPKNPGMLIAADGRATLTYSLIPLVPGSISVPGISLTVSDPFFTASLVMGTKAFFGPELDVHPRAAYERSRSREDFGAQEKDRTGIYRGYGIRSIREYIHGDDLRSIDWKMTAKHDRMFIREYTAIENVPPLIVVDLPDRSFAVPDESIAQIINGVSGEATTAIRNYGSVSLFLISGINIIDILLDEKDLHRVISILRRSAHPAFRLHHAYRWKNRAVMRGFVKKSRSTVFKENKDESGRFFANIAQVYQKSLASPDIPIFSKQVRRLFDSLLTEDIVIYSLFEGDLSHIREIAYQATIHRIRLKLRTVAGQDAAKIVAVKKALGIDTLEVIP